MFVARGWWDTVEKTACRQDIMIEAKFKSDPLAPSRAVLSPNTKCTYADRRTKMEASDENVQFWIPGKLGFCIFQAQRAKFTFRLTFNR